MSKAVTQPSGYIRAFTIVELLVVIAIIAILAAVTIVTYSSTNRRAQETTLQSDLKNAAAQLALDSNATGKYPISKEAANKGKGLAKSAGTSYEYTYVAANNSYCLTASSHGVGVAVFHITSSDSAIQSGPCSGHTGQPNDDGSGGGGDDGEDDDGEPEQPPQPTQPDDCPSGYIPVPGNATFGTQGGFCVMKYEAKYHASGVPVSQPASAPWASISQTSASAAASAACSGCHLITEAEWMTIAADVVSVDSNWSGGSVGSGYVYSGHNDGSPSNTLAASADDTKGYTGTGNSSGKQRRTLTLSNGEIIWDLAGNLTEWTSTTIAGGQQPGPASESSYAIKQWTNATIQWNGLPSTSRPSALPGQAATWSSSQGIGQLKSRKNESTIHAYARGGDLGDGNFAGILALSLEEETTTPYSWVGFRVAR